MEKIVVLTGAGMSADSGISTFRDAGGLWEGHDVMEVASPQGFAKNPELVLDFYNLRRKQLFEVEPNAGHKALAELENHFEVHVVTQNVDDLHERAGSSNVLHLHGELRKVRSVGNPSHILDWDKDLVLGDLCEYGHQLRPHIVWFGEMVPMLEPAIELVNQADKLLIIGTSLQVYPAAGLSGYAPADCPIYYIDPRPSLNYELRQRKDVVVIEDTAANGTPDLVEELVGR
ncbi:MAG: NAD-dependent deacylase [Bacteroidetes bacterium]|nr:NAD-dependent deacylase [Bacteroidota bacterium]